MEFEDKYYSTLAQMYFTFLSLSPEEYMSLARPWLSSYSYEHSKQFNVLEVEILVSAGHSELFGNGPLDSVLYSPLVTRALLHEDEDDVRIFATVNGEVTETNARFHSKGHRRRIIERMQQRSELRVAYSNGMVAISVIREDPVA